MPTRRGTQHPHPPDPPSAQRHDGRSTSRSAVLVSGDVLVSRPSARADVYDISVVSEASHTSKTRYEEAMDTGRELARALAVNGWFTCDQTHYLRLAT